MKQALILPALALAVACAAFDCQPFGPAAPTLHCANFQTEPLAVGGLADNGYSQLYSLTIRPGANTTPGSRFCRSPAFTPKMPAP